MMLTSPEVAIQELALADGCLGDVLRGWRVKRRTPLDRRFYRARFACRLCFRQAFGQRRFGFATNSVSWACYSSS